MRHAWASGMENRAISLYNALYDHLGKAFDQEPEEQTVALLAKIKLGEDTPPEESAPQTPPPPRQPRLLVQRIEADGLTSVERNFLSVLVLDFRSRLARFREWTIVDEGQLGDGAGAPPRGQARE